MHSKLTSEVSVIPADDPLLAPRMIAPRRQGVEYSVEHHGQRVESEDEAADGSDMPDTLLPNDKRPHPPLVTSPGLPIGDGHSHSIVILGRMASRSSASDLGAVIPIRWSLEVWN